MTLLRTLALFAGAAAIFALAGCGTYSGSPSPAVTAQPLVGPETSASRTLEQNLSSSPQLTTILRLINRGELDATLRAPGPYTLFAANESAISRIPKPAYARLWVSVNRPRVHYLAGYQVLRGRYDAARLKRVAQKHERIRTLEGEKITPRLESGRLYIEDVHGREIDIVESDIKASNGVMHVVGRLPVPGAYLK
ncbi:MAG: fasciclin domain-containing protein [Solirubrobacterales bacterium]